MTGLGRGWEGRPLNARRAARLPLLLAFAAAAAFGAAVGLWTHLGATMFFETIRTGFALCGV